MGVECELLQLETRTKKKCDVVPRRRLVGHDLLFEVTIPPHASWIIYVQISIDGSRLRARLSFPGDPRYPFLLMHSGPIRFLSHRSYAAAVNTAS